MKQLAILVTILCLMMSSCGEKQEGEFISPYFQDLGKSKVEIFETYDITEEDVYTDHGATPGIYIFPKKVTYLEIPKFSLAFQFDALEEKHQFYAFTYYRIYDGASEELLPLIKSLYQRFTEWYSPLQYVSQTGFEQMMNAVSIQDLKNRYYTDTWTSLDDERMAALYLIKNNFEDKWVIAVQYRWNYNKDFNKKQKYH